jgi:hypothetical protein
MGCHNIMSGEEPWQGVVSGIVRKWTNRNSASTANSTPEKPGSGPEHDQRVFREAGFEDVESYSFVHPHIWTVESIIGNLYSTSRCSKRILGDAIGGFEADLKRNLLAHDASGNFQEEMRFGYTLGRKSLKETGGWSGQSPGCHG